MEATKSEEVQQDEVEGEEDVESVDNVDAESSDAVSVDGIAVGEPHLHAPVHAAAAARGGENAACPEGAG